MEGTDFVRHLASYVVSSVQTTASMRNLIGDSNLIGAYTEGLVRELAARVVRPLRISRGTIVYEGCCPDHAREIDAIMWSPNPFPPIEAGEFAIVPRGSAIGYLEIKRSLYSEAAKDMQNTLDLENDLVPPLRGELGHRALGVCCIQQLGQRTSATMKTLLEDRRAVILFQEQEDKTFCPKADAICDFVNFLVKIRRRVQSSDRLLVIPPSEMSGNTTAIESYT